MHGPPPRRRGDRHQSRRRDRDWSTSACPATSAACCSAREIASLYVQPHIGGDLALLTGIAKRIVELRRRRRASSSPTIATAGSSSKRICAAISTGTISSPRSGVEREADRRDRRPLRRRQAAWSSVGRWASRTICTAWPTCRRSPTWPCCGAWSAGPTADCCRFAATRTCKAWARSASRRKLKEAVFQRLESHFDVRLPHGRRASTRWAAIDAAADGRREARLLPGRKPLRLQPRRQLRGPSHRQAGPGRLSQHHAQHGARPRAGGARRSSCRCSPATKSRSRRRRSRCSASSATATAARAATRARAARSKSSPSWRAACSTAGGRSIGSGSRKTREIRHAIGKIVPGWEPMAEIDRHPARVPHRRPADCRAAFSDRHRPGYAVRP